jgi:hypothetical protein
MKRPDGIGQIYLSECFAPTVERRFGNVVPAAYRLNRFVPSGLPQDIEYGSA